LAGYFATPEHFKQFLVLQTLTVVDTMFDMNRCLQRRSLASKQIRGNHPVKEGRIILFLVKRTRSVSFSQQTAMAGVVLSMDTNQ
jgi:hypothetical protein